MKDVIDGAASPANADRGPSDARRVERPQGRAAPTPSLSPRALGPLAGPRDDAPPELLGPRAEVAVRGVGLRLAAVVRGEIVEVALAVAAVLAEEQVVRGG